MKSTAVPVDTLPSVNFTGDRAYEISLRQTGVICLVTTTMIIWRAKLKTEFLMRTVLPTKMASSTQLRRKYISLLSAGRYAFNNGSLFDEISAFVQAGALLFPNDATPRS